MKIMLFFATVCAIVPFECCFCKGKADGVLAVDSRRDVVKYSPCLVSLSSVKQSKIFFESLSSQSQFKDQKFLTAVARETPFSVKKQHCLKNEDLSHKELREQFERGDFDKTFDIARDHSLGGGRPLPVSESEECVTRRVIKSLVPKKDFSEESAQEYNDIMGSWFECMRSYGVGIPTEYEIAYTYIKNLLNNRHQLSQHSCIKREGCEKPIFGLSY
jgi:hypothetical protein